MFLSQVPTSILPVTTFFSFSVGDVSPQLSTGDPPIFQASPETSQLAAREKLCPQVHLEWGVIGDIMLVTSHRDSLV